MSIGVHGQNSLERDLECDICAEIIFNLRSQLSLNDTHLETQTESSGGISEGRENSRGMRCPSGRDIHHHFEGCQSIQRSLPHTPATS